METCCIGCRMPSHIVGGLRSTPGGLACGYLCLEVRDEVKPFVVFGFGHFAFGAAVVD